MLVYLMAPYSRVADKDALMKALYTIAHDYMKKNPTHQVVSPLFYHYSVGLVPGVDGDWNFWGNYSTGLLRKCDKAILLAWDGWQESTGIIVELKLLESLNIPVETRFPS